MFCLSPLLQPLELGSFAMTIKLYKLAFDWQLNARWKLGFVTLCAYL
jgi:hypothetical protein